MKVINLDGRRNNSNFVSRILKSGMIAGIVSMTILSGCKDNDDAEITQQQITSQSQQIDQTFVTKASMANRAEIELGQLAASMGSHDSIRAFGMHMVTEHTIAQNELIERATRNGFSVEDRLDPAHTEMKQRLQALQGFQFDSLYITGQVMDHELSLQNFELERSQGQNQDIRVYAERFTPHISSHYQKAINLRGMILENVENNNAGTNNGTNGTGIENNGTNGTGTVNNGTNGTGNLNTTGTVNEYMNNPASDNAGVGL